MRSGLWIASLALIASQALPASAQAPVSAPKGWTLDMAHAQKIHVEAILVPAGTKWETTLAKVFVRSVAKNDRIKTADDVLNGSIGGMKGNGSPRIVGTPQPPIAVKGGKAKVWHVTGARFGDMMAMAFIDRKDAVKSITLSARNKTEFQKALPAFTAIVKSYK